MQQHLAHSRCSTNTYRRDEQALLMLQPGPERRPTVASGHLKGLRNASGCIYQGSHTGLCARYSVRCKRIKTGIYSHMRGTSFTPRRHWQAKTPFAHVFGKMFKIFSCECQEVEYRNVEEKGERKSSLLPPLNLIRGA